MGNRLKIEADHIKLEFSGDSSNIRTGYEMTRELLIMHFQEQLQRAGTEAPLPAPPASSEPPSEQRKRDTTQQLHIVRDAKNWVPPNQSMHISITLLSRLYNKVCTLEREEFEDSIFGDVIDFDHVQRVFIRSNQSHIFREHFEIGKVLWRELTAEGRAAVRSDDS